MIDVADVQPLDYCLVEAVSWPSDSRDIADPQQIGDWSVLDCEKHTPEKPYAIVQVPPYTSQPTTTPTKSTLPHVNGTASALSNLSSLLPTLPSSLAAGVGAAIQPKPLTKAAFAPYGNVLEAYPDPKTHWEGQDIQTAPDGKTAKYARLADVSSTYPADSGAVTGISVFRATPKVGLERGKVFDVRFFERHQYTSQAFVPMGKGEVSSAERAAMRRVDLGRTVWELPGVGSKGIARGRRLIIVEGQRRGSAQGRRTDARHRREERSRRQARPEHPRGVHHAFVERNQLQRGRVA